MKTQTKVTKSIKSSEIKRVWHLVDVSGKILGRITPEISKFLQGKHKVNYVAYLDSGDYVVVINANKVVLTGKKSEDKQLLNYSGYPGGLRIRPIKKVMKDNPAEVVRHTVSGMLPKNKLRDVRLARLHIFSGDKHPYQDKINHSKS